MSDRAPGGRTASADPSSAPSPVAAAPAAQTASAGYLSSPRHPRHRLIPHRQRSFARRLRHNETPEEARLWALLRNRRFIDHKFRRQVPIGRYIVDFVCLPSRLIVELDGSQHAESRRDAIRDAWLESQNFRIFRIWNNELAHGRQSVLDAVWHAPNINNGDPP